MLKTDNAIIQNVFSKQKNFFKTEATKSVAFRKESLQKLKQSIVEHTADLYAALDSDQPDTYPQIPPRGIRKYINIQHFIGLQVPNEGIHKSLYFFNLFNLWEMSRLGHGFKSRAWYCFC